MEQATEVLIVGYKTADRTIWFDGSTPGKTPYKRILLCCGDVYTDGKGKAFWVRQVSPNRVTVDVTKDYLDWVNDQPNGIHETYEAFLRGTR